MKRMSSSVAALLALTALSPLGGVVVAADSPEARADVAKQSERNTLKAPSVVTQAMRALYGGRGPSWNRHPNGPGWSQAQVQRMARKRRNQRRNKLAHRR